MEWSGGMAGQWGANLSASAASGGLLARPQTVLIVELTGEVVGCHVWMFLLSFLVVGEGEGGELFVRFFGGLAAAPGDTGCLGSGSLLLLQRRVTQWMQNIKTIVAAATLAPYNPPLHIHPHGTNLHTNAYTHTHPPWSSSKKNRANSSPP